MKLKIALLLATLSAPLAAGCKACPPPAEKPSGAKSQIARGGDYHDDSLSNRADRAGEMGDTNREQNLENREDNAEQRQDNR